MEQFPSHTKIQGNQKTEAFDVSLSQNFLKESVEMLLPAWARSSTQNGDCAKSV